MILLDFPKNGWCHLVAKDLNTLHSFAQKIGLKKDWFQPGRNKPHYDIRGKFIKEAIKFGAIQVSSKRIVTFLNENYS